MKLHASLISLISLVALPLASFAGQPSGGTSTVGFGGTAIPGGSQSTSYVISASGSYYLAGERVMTSSVPAIIVNAPDVTVDLNGGTIRYTSSAVTAGITIPNCSNVEIRNGSVTDVPGNGIMSSGGVGLRVKSVRITSCDSNGISSTTSHATFEDCHVSYCKQWGIYVYTAEAVRVVGCVLVRNAKSGVTLAAVEAGEVSHCDASANQESGIYCNFTGCLITDNVVHFNNLSKSYANAGIVAGSRCFVRGNTVDGNYLTGVYAANGPAIIEANVITSTLDANMNVTGTAIVCNQPGTVYVNNRITNGTVLLGGLVNGGGNLFF